MLLVLSDLNPEVVFAWTQIFVDYQNVSYRCASSLRANVDAVVSPANSFGFMDGGIDLAYRNFFGLAIQRRVREVIRDRYGEEAPVGNAFFVPTGHDCITRMVVSRPRLSGWGYPHGNRYWRDAPI